MPYGGASAVQFERVVPGTLETESWIEIFGSQGHLADSWRGGKGARLFAWSPDAKYLSYVGDAPGATEEADAKKGQLSDAYLKDRNRQNVTVLLERVEGRVLRWSRTEIARYWATSRATRTSAGSAPRRMMDSGVLPRQAVPTSRVSFGVRRRLTAGAVAARAQGFHPMAGACCSPATSRI